MTSSLIPLASIELAPLVYTLLVAFTIAGAFYSFLQGPIETEAMQESPVDGMPSDPESLPLKPAVSAPSPSLTTFYYLDSAGAVQGPLTVPQMREAEKTGVINLQTKVAKAGEDEWLTLSAWADFLDRPAATALNSARPYAPAFAPDADETPKTVGQGLQQAGVIIGALGLGACVLEGAAFGPVGAGLGGGALGLGVILFIIGSCLP